MYRIGIHVRHNITVSNFSSSNKANNWLIHVQLIITTCIHVDDVVATYFRQRVATVFFLASKPPA